MNHMSSYMSCYMMTPSIIKVGMATVLTFNTISAVTLIAYGLQGSCTFSTIHVARVHHPQSISMYALSCWAGVPFPADGAL